jgi:hypothetical protein
MQGRVGWSLRCRHDHDPWRDVKIDCGFGAIGLGEESGEGQRRLEAITGNTRNAIRAVLRESFTSPREGARALDAYWAWTMKADASARLHPIPRAVQQWRRFEERWTAHMRTNGATRFAEFNPREDVDFGPARRLSRGRGRSL